VELFLSDDLNCQEAECGVDVDIRLGLICMRNWMSRVVGSIGTDWNCQTEKGSDAYKAPIIDYVKTDQTEINAFI
jgi:hypothetical protein